MAILPVQSRLQKKRSLSFRRMRWEACLQSQLRKLFIKNLTRSDESSSA